MRSLIKKCTHPESLPRFIDVLESAIDRTAQRVLRPMQPGDVRCTVAKLESSALELDWCPTTSIEKGIPQLVDWVRSYYVYGRRANTGNL